MLPSGIFILELLTNGNDDLGQTGYFSNLGRAFGIMSVYKNFKMKVDSDKDEKSLQRKEDLS
ncbi:hypothetical protein [Paenibacillus prosopidis]|uniref:Uncharacterized protein n=1 Tax=Paenibacillus prosopidis TaxID=630520 RepID=A0A368W522_9BACL|nr:hypothetical protein [Paenibacillus prosopidis]RCW50863.1 hypothetical protein DFP97_10255 [Paenibacillus prosopidis]